MLPGLLFCAEDFREPTFSSPCTCFPNIFGSFSVILSGSTAYALSEMQEGLGDKKSPLSLGNSF